MSRPRIIVGVGSRSVGECGGDLNCGMLLFLLFGLEGRELELSWPMLDRKGGLMLAFLHVMHLFIWCRISVSQP